MDIRPFSHPNVKKIRSIAKISSIIVCKELITKNPKGGLLLLSADPNHNGSFVEILLVDCRATHGEECQNVNFISSTDYYPQDV